MSFGKGLGKEAEKEIMILLDQDTGSSIVVP